MSLIPFSSSWMSPVWGRHHNHDPFASMLAPLGRRDLWDEDDLGMDVGLFDIQRELSRPMRVQVQEKDGSYDLIIDHPGLDSKDINISLDNNVLTISGQRKEEERNEHEYRRSFSSSSRTIPLPPDVDANKIDAHHDGNRLCVMLPKKAEAQGKRRNIAIKQGQSQKSIPMTSQKVSEERKSQDRETTKM